MDATGSSHEGWMTAVPLAVLVIIVTYVVGGPVAFVSTLSYWGSELINALVSWLKYF